MTQQSRTGGQILVDALQIHGVDTAFGVPGESYLDVLDALHDSGIRFIINRQEGGAAFMAEAYGKLTGKPGICFVTRGPGATNASIGVHNAFQDSTPMVLFVGDVGSDFRDREAFQEVDYASFFGPSTKGFAKRVERIDDADRMVPHSQQPKLYRALAALARMDGACVIASVVEADYDAPGSVPVTLRSNRADPLEPLSSIHLISSPPASDAATPGPSDAPASETASPKEADR